MYKLTIKAHAKSRARLLGLRIENFIVGHYYDIYFVVKNIGEETTPPHKINIHIHWPGHTAISQRPLKVKSLEPGGKCHKSETWKFQALSTGLATIHAVPELSKIGIYKKDGKHRISSREAFGTFYATTPEALYEYYGLWLAAVGLFLTAVDWNLYRFLFICAFGLIFVAFKINCSIMQKLHLIFSLAISGYLGQFSYWMSILRVIGDTIRAGYLRSAPYISEYSIRYGIKWRVHFVLRTPIQYHMLMIAGITFMFWSFYTLYKVTTSRAVS